MKATLPESLKAKLLRRKEWSVRWAHRALAGALTRMPQGPDLILGSLLERQPFSPELVIRGYLQGFFPSAIHVTGDMRWHHPDLRGVIPIQEFHVPKRLGKLVRNGKFEVRIDSDFQAVIEGCAEPAPRRQTTYLKPEVIEVYMELHRRGLAHCVETWQNGELVGGTYGLALGGYFASESAFWRVRDASKVATVHLTEILRKGGFILHDMWWPTKDMEQFGGYSMAREEFKNVLARALITPASFDGRVARW